MRFFILGRTLKGLFINFLVNLLDLLDLVGFLILLTSAISGDGGLGSLRNLLIRFNLFDAWRVVKIVELVRVGFLIMIKLILIRREIVLAITLTIASVRIFGVRNVVTSEINIVVSVNLEVDKLVITDDKIKSLLIMLLKGLVTNS